jgi:acetolactate decarboxylase
MKNNSGFYRVLIATLALLPLFAGGCSPDNTGIINTSSRDTVTQISTIDSLLNGLYDGVTDFNTVKKYGDFGIGTVDRLDGEVIILGGKVYQVKSDGKVYRVKDSTTTPFATVTYFETDTQEKLSSGMTFAQVNSRIDSVIPTQNIFYAIKITGTFSYMKTRSVPAQQKPYPALADVTKNQPVFEFGETSGTVVGFRTPQFAGSLNVAGYHFHFLNEAKDAGGHILDFTVKDATVYIDETSDFTMFLPNSSDFYNIDLSRDQQAVVTQVEK